MLVVVLWGVDKSSLGYWYIGSIPFICYVLLINYISTLEKKAEIDKKVKIISWICFFANRVPALHKFCLPLHSGQLNRKQFVLHRRKNLRAFQNLILP